MIGCIPDHIEDESLDLWTLAHRWHDRDPALTNPYAPPEPVLDTLHLLTRALLQDQLSTSLTPDRADLDGLQYCVTAHLAVRSLYESVFVEREALRNFCRWLELPLPRFWFPPNPTPPPPTGDRRFHRLRPCRFAPGAPIRLWGKPPLSED